MYSGGLRTVYYIGLAWVQYAPVGFAAATPMADAPAHFVMEEALNLVSNASLRCLSWKTLEIVVIFTS